MKSVSFLSLVLLFAVSPMFGQNIVKNKYGLAVVSDISSYKQIVQKDSNCALIDLTKFLPGLPLDIRYATTNNFTKTKLYNKAKAYALYPVAKALRKIREELGRQNIDIKIHDAYRPYAVSLKMWDVCPNDSYVANPKKGSRHNRGCAIDLTIVDKASGKELEMPTPYDTFSNKARDTYRNLPEKVLKNRKILRDVMEKYGFAHSTSEWWHFDFIGWKKYPLLDMSFEVLESIK